MGKTLVFENGGSGCGAGIGELGTLAALGANGGMGGANSMWPMMMMGSGGGFGGGMWNNPIWAIVFLAALQNGGLFGGNGCGRGNCGGAQDIEIQNQLSSIREQLGTNQNTSLLMDAIKGNGGAVRDLATNLNCDFNAVNAAINAVQTAICNIGSKVDMNAMQTINAINSGDASLSSQLSSCCCDIREAITRGNYENQLATVNQTNALQNSLNFVNSSVERGFAATNYATQQQTCELKNAITAQTTLINDKFCQLEMREMQNKIDALRTENQTLRFAESQQAQNNYLISQLQPVARPAYLTCSPYQAQMHPFGYYGYNNGGCGCNNGCGCNG